MKESETQDRPVSNRGNTVKYSQDSIPCCVVNSILNTIVNSCRIIVSEIRVDLCKNRREIDARRRIEERATKCPPRTMNDGQRWQNRQIGHNLSGFPSLANAKVGKSWKNHEKLTFSMYRPPHGAYPLDP